MAYPGIQISSRAQNIIRSKHRLPIGFYILKDRTLRLTENKNFLDAILILVGFLAIVTALSFYPIALLVVFVVLLFAVTLYNPFIGLIIFMVLSFFPLMYQVPAIAWFYLFIFSAMLIYGYMHYRTIVFLFVLVGLAFSPLGYFLEIPALIFATLIIGFRRSVLVSVLAVLAIVSSSAIMGVQNTGFILYNGIAAHQNLGNSILFKYLTPDKPILSITNFIAGTGSAFAAFSNGEFIGSISHIFIMFIEPLTMQFIYLVQIAILVAMAFLIEYLAINRRAKYKGAESSLVGAAYPAFYYFVSVAAGMDYNYFLPIISFALAPITLFILELYNVKIVKALDVRKQDIKMKFGEAFEDLQTEGVGETFDDISNYEATKKQLTEAVIAPIERRGISRAYNVKPAKGILFFGPPGTGKTMMMRALANELHASIFHVKTSSLISSFAGETEKRISNIFAIAKKHAPCVLFVDEVDSIASSRTEAVDETRQQALSQLLQEMDGFEKLDNVVLVCATNIPSRLDPAILRPGRIDRIVYIGLPDYNGRKLIFKKYLKNLPLSEDVDLDEITEATERYSPADIKVLCESVAQMVAQEAAAKHKILGITQDDMMNVISKTKPSTTLAQIDEYNTFRIDFERSRGMEEPQVEKQEGQVSFKDVIGLEDAKKAVIDAVQVPLLHPDLMKKYDIKNINGILLFGPPGTGKTMLMRAISNEFESVTLLQIDTPMLHSQGVDKATLIVKSIFDRARENKPAIIFIDEIEALFPKRETGSIAEAQVTTEALRQMDGIKKLSGVVVVGATNRPEDLDTAILRAGRFDKLIFVKPPDKNNRALMFKEYLSMIPLADDVDFDALGAESKGFTGADISGVCREIKSEALDKNIKSGEEVKITMEDIEEVVENTKASAPDSIMGNYLNFLATYGKR